jgi:hypothetical protein
MERKIPDAIPALQDRAQTKLCSGMNAEEKSRANEGSMQS